MRKIFTLFISLGLGAVFIHFYVVKHADAMRFIYPVEARLSGLNSSCSAGSPKWLYILIRDSLLNRYSPANQVAYIDPEGKLHHCENGRLDKLFGAPLRADSRYRYASLTKVVTAAVILRLIRNGQLSFDSKLVNFVELGPVKDQRINSITVENLLNHTAGFDRTTLKGDAMFSFPRPWCPNDPDQLAKEKLLFAPGEKQIYSNLGYCLLGLIVEKITKKPYREFVEETIAISKYNIKFIDGPFLDDEVTYDFLNDGIFNENYYKSLDFNSGSSSAGLSGSASAFAKLVREIIDSKIDILARSSFSGCNESEIKGCYGYAFDHYQRDDESMKVYFHDGYIPGASSLLVIDENGGVLVLLNAGRVRFQKEQNEKFALVYELLQQYRH